MAEQRRQTFANKISRAESLIKSGKIENEQSIELNERMELLKEAFAEFSAEHLKLIEKSPQSEFKKHDAFYANIDEKYQASILCLRKSIAKAEAKELNDRMKQTNEQKVKTENIEPTREDAPNQTNVCDSSSEGPSFNEEHQLQSELNRNTPKFHLNMRQTQKSNIREDLRKKLEQNRSKMRKVRADLNRLNQKKISCFNCGGPHPMCKCNAIENSTLRERERRVAELGLCRNCFMPKRNRHRCSAQHSHCVRCGPTVFHNSLLCPKAR